LLDLIINNNSKLIGNNLILSFQDKITMFFLKVFSNFTLQQIGKGNVCTFSFNT